MVRDEEDRRAAEREGFRRREVARQRCLLGGLMIRPASDIVQRVGVRNLSPAGAKLVLDGLGIVYPDAVLVVPKMAAAWAIEVVWRDLPEAGVRFTREHPLAGDAHLVSVLRAAAA